MAIKYVRANLEALVKGNKISNIPGVTEISLIHNEGDEEGVYTATISAPAMSSYNLDDHVFNVKVSAATDAAETVVDKNTTGEIGQQCRLRVYEREAPRVSFKNPQSDNEFIKDASISVVVEMSDIVLDNNSPLEGVSKDSGIDQSSVYMSITKDGVDYPVDEKTELEAVLEDGKLIGTYTPTNGFEEGVYKVTLRISDFDGNQSQDAERTFTIDVSAPKISLTYPTQVVTEKNVTIKGETDADPTIEVAITFNGQVYKTNPNEDGTFEYTVTNVQDGTYIVSAVATDKAGNTSPTAASLTVVVSTSAPVIQSVEFVPVETPDITQAKLYKIKVKVVLKDV